MGFRMRGVPFRCPYHLYLSKNKFISDISCLQTYYTRRDWIGKGFCIIPIDGHTHKRNALIYKRKIAGYLPAILSRYVYLSFPFRFPVHLYYPAAVRAFQRHDDPAGTRLPNVTGPFFAPPLRAFHFPDNTTSLPPIHLLLSPRTDMEQGNQPVPAGSLLSSVYYWFSSGSPIPRSARTPGKPVLSGATLATSLFRRARNLFPI